MRKLGIILIILSGFPPHYADSQKEWAPVGAEWFFSSTMNHTFSKYTAERDTLIVGKKCSIITHQGKMVEIMYEEDGKVFYRFDEKFNLIYDFSVQTGDTVPFIFKGLSSSLDVEAFRINYVVESIENKTFHTSKLDYKYQENLDYAIWETAPTAYKYRERTGVEIGCIDGLLLSIAICTDDIILRCYHDSEINYVSDLWSIQNKPCDYTTDDRQVSGSSSFSVFPNPVSDELSIELPVLKPTNRISVDILDITGNFLKTIQLVEKNSKVIVSDLGSGTYFLRFFDGSEMLYNTKIFKL